MASVLKISQNKKTVLVGGCFDVLHPGHVIFLEKAKKAGDVLLVLLESDEKIKKLKGVKRPVHTQIEREKVLLALKYVDQVARLPFIEDENDYYKIILKIKPDIIAVTSGVNNSHHKRVAKRVGAKIKYVTKIVGNHSTSRILNENLR